VKLASLSAIRPELRWLCAATVVASAAVYLTDPELRNPGAALAGTAVAATEAPKPATPTASASSAISPTPRPLSEAIADPFDPIVVAPPPPPPAPKPPPAPPPPPPPPPPLTWRYFGQMMLPDHKQQVFLARGEQVLPIEAGQQLDDGFIVDAITAENVRVRHVASGVQFSIALPEAAAPATQ
jgi:hypothetical protein